MLLPIPGDIYISRITRAESIIEGVVTAGSSSVDKDEYIIFRNMGSPFVRSKMDAKHFEDEFDFVRSTE